MSPAITLNKTPVWRQHILWHILNDLNFLQATIHVGGGLSNSLHVPTEELTVDISI